MNIKKVLEKIEITEAPIEPLGKPFDLLNNKISAFEKLRKHSKQNYSESYLSRIYLLTIVLITASIFFCFL